MALSEVQAAAEAVEAVRRNLANLSDQQVKDLEWMLWVECQDRFVAIGDVEMLDDYRNKRGA